MIAHVINHEHISVVPLYRNIMPAINVNKKNIIIHIKYSKIIIYFNFSFTTFAFMRFYECLFCVTTISDR